ncbi:MAG: type II/IV secretion system protein [Candidatus Omnitrophica bacterium]|nr:type II/IV secretion system protein [Candidatus Omnitrophota bacterium]
MATTRRLKPLYELLLEQGTLNQEQLDGAQAHAEQSGQPLRRILVQAGLMTESALVELMAAQSGLATVDLSTHVIRPDVLQLIPPTLARRHTLIPIFKIAETLTIAIADPLNFLAMDDVRLQVGGDVKAVLASESSIRKALDQYYGPLVSLKEVSQAIKAAEQPHQVDGAATADEGPVVRLVNLLVMQAVKEHASDIHLEPGNGVLRTRFRIDGVLHQVPGPSKALQSAVVSRIKVLADMDIAERRKAQDGRFRLSIEDQDIDVRVSTIPTPFGEKVVMRLLHQSREVLDLGQLGLAADALKTFQQLVHSPHGIVLVTGPTGSGKTTTLYAALQMTNDLQKNILTIEDPIEAQLPGINQVQVNPKAEMTFASALRSFLRQDPDILMVGEIRDRETAQIAMQAALTGHLVFSTLHTNDAPSSLTRLAEMAVDRFLIASSVIGILAQRLVRVICPRCKESYRATAQLASEIQLKEGALLFRGKGCSTCRQSGYKGRIGIFELLPVTEAIKDLLVAKTPDHEIREAARKAGMRTLREDGFVKALAGVTTVEEVLRVTQLE